MNWYMGSEMTSFFSIEHAPTNMMVSKNRNNLLIDMSEKPETSMFVRDSLIKSNLIAQCMFFTALNCF